MESSENPRITALSLSLADYREGTVLMGTLLTPRFAPTAETATHSLPRGCGPKLLLTACQEDAVKNCYSQPAKRVRLKTVTHAGPRTTF